MTNIWIRNTPKCVWPSGGLESGPLQHHRSSVEHI